MFAIAFYDLQVITYDNSRRSPITDLSIFNDNLFIPPTLIYMYTYTTNYNLPCSNMEEIILIYLYLYTYSKVLEVQRENNMKLIADKTYFSHIIHMNAICYNLKV